MENKNPILIELNDISPVIAGVGNHNPYFVPKGYFDNLAVQVFLRIALEEKAGTDPVLNINKDNVYQVPENYFESLAENILNRIKAQENDAKDELELLSPLLGKIGKKTPFTSPENYFTDFSENVMAGVKAVEFVNEELENLSPTMLELKSKQVYEVPEGYFDTNPAIILDKAKQQQPAKVLSVNFGRKIMKYAAAAIITGMIGLSGYLYLGNSVSKPPVASSKLGFDSSFAKVSDQDIENFLDNNAITLADIGTDTSIGTDSSNTVSTDGMNANDSKDLLADISDEELQKYVDQHVETPITN
ncbi:MAG: hypothetical protein ABJB86_13525 [Bacteroidota bacterium]